MIDYQKLFHMLYDELNDMIEELLQLRKQVAELYKKGITEEYILKVGNEDDMLLTEELEAGVSEQGKKRG